MSLNPKAFPQYKEFNPDVPVYCVSNGNGGVFHRFFDTSPFSPTGRYIAGFRMPFEDRLPLPGEKGEIVVVDLQTGEEKTVDSTCGWEPQLGANLQWGADDSILIFNDVDPADWSEFGVKLNWKTGERKRLEGTVYKVSPDGKKALSAKLSCMRRTQHGYGVMLPPERVQNNLGLRDDEGLWLTDIDSGKKTLLISIKEVFERTCTKKELEFYKDREVYLFHSKWNNQGTKIMFSVRNYPQNAGIEYDAICGKPLRFDVFTMNNDCSELYNAIPDIHWERGGHHTTWLADGQRLSFNLGNLNGGMHLMQVKYDGSGLKLLTRNTPGSGHPSENPNCGTMVTDSYVREVVAKGDGTTPIRFIDLAQDKAKDIIRIQTETPYEKQISCLRVDPHVAWDKSGRYIAFNAFTGGTRRLFVADMKDFKI